MDIRITNKGLLEINSSEKFNSVDLEERSLVNQGRIPKRYSSSIKRIDNKYLYYINLSEIDLYDNQIFDLLIDNRKYYINKIIKEVKSINQTNYECFLYKNKTGTISLKIESKIKNINASVEKINDGIFKIDILNKDIVNKSIDIVLKKRVRNDLELYCDEIELQKDINIENYIYIKKNNISSKKLKDGDQWDFYLRIYINNLHYDVAINIEDNLDDELEMIENNELFENKFIAINYKLCMKVIRSKLTPIKEVKFENNDKIIIEFVEDKDYKVISCYLKPRQNNNIKFSNLTSVKYELSNNHKKYFIDNENIKKLLLPFNIIVWDYYCLVLNIKTGNTTEIMLTTDKDINKKAIKVDNYKLEHYKTDIKTIALRVTKSELKYEKVKIGILGSCFSRSAFQSNEFFNLDYKDKYEVVFTSFHTSIPSIISKPKKVEDEYLKDANDFQRRTIKNDFSKSFFYDIKKNNIDFLIIDLYPDAVRPLLVYEDGSMITDSYTLRQSEYIYKVGNPKVFNYKNLIEYIKIWEESFEIFAKELEENFDTRKIILQRARTSTKIKDINGRIENFNSIEVLESRIANSLFEYMELHFIKRFPECEVIDIIKKNYVAFIGHPEGRSVSHYQTEYYKEFMHQLDRIVINKLKNNSYL